ncbi:minor capsid protein inhibitor of protease [Pectobacterium phage POP12]|nr:minor capsid protein inhibitor of protease [Pectobacterium phage POP12]
MIDNEKIESFRGLEQKEAKAKLAEYAATFEIKLNKQKSFDNMLIDFQTEHAKIPVQEKIELEQKIDDVPLKLDELVEGEETETILAGLEAVEPVFEPTNITIEGETFNRVDMNELSLAIEAKDVVYPDWMHGFQPTLTLIGSSSAKKGYYTCPWWIYDWIVVHDDWKLYPEDCQHYGAENILKSLAYFVYTTGDVMIRETRNSNFVVLK